MSESRIKIGVDVLDRELGGGIELGSSILLEVESQSQAEILLHKFSQNRPTGYITTIQDKDFITDIFNDYGISEVDHVWEYTSESDLDNLHDASKTLEEESILIIDTVSVLEQLSTERYRKFINRVVRDAKNTNSTVIFYRVDYNVENDINKTLTEHLSDVIINIETQMQNGEMVNYLKIPKFRGTGPIKEQQKISFLEDGITIDTSKNIA